MLSQCCDFLLGIHANFTALFAGNEDIIRVELLFARLTLSYDVDFQEMKIIGYTYRSLMLVDEAKF